MRARLPARFAGHISLLLAFMPLRDRLLVLTYTATALCQLLAAIVKVGIAVEEVRTRTRFPFRFSCVTSEHRYPAQKLFATDADLTYNA